MPPSELSPYQRLMPFEATAAPPPRVDSELRPFNDYLGDAGRANQPQQEPFGAAAAPQQRQDREPNNADHDVAADTAGQSEHDASSEHAGNEQAAAEHPLETDGQPPAVPTTDKKSLVSSEDEFVKSEEEVIVAVAPAAVAGPEESVPQQAAKQAAVTGNSVPSPVNEVPGDEAQPSVLPRSERSTAARPEQTWGAPNAVASPKVGEEGSETKAVKVAMVDDKPVAKTQSMPVAEKNQIQESRDTAQRPVAERQAVADGKPVTVATAEPSSAETVPSRAVKSQSPVVPKAAPEPETVGRSEPALAAVDAGKIVETPPVAAPASVAKDERKGDGKPVAKPAHQPLKGQPNVPARQAAENGNEVVRPTESIVNTVAAASMANDEALPAETQTAGNDRPATGGAVVAREVSGVQPGPRTPISLVPPPRDGSSDAVSLTPQERTRFVQRVANAFQAASQREGEIRLRLSPPELGQLKLEISIKQGVLTARMETDTAESRQVLLDNLPQLRDRLAEQSIKVEKFDVNVRDDSQQRQAEQQNDNGAKQQESRQQSHRKEAKAAAAVAETAGSTIGLSSDQLDILI